MVLAFGLVFIIAACGAEKHPAARAVEDFIQALVDKDETRYISLTCGDYEADALLMYDAFSLVQTRLENLDCQAIEIVGDSASVACQGKIIASYSNEDQEFELSQNRYQVIQQGGEWLVCGE